LTTAVPNAFAAGVKVSNPLAAIAGWILNSAVLVLLVTMKVSVCPLSFGPALIAVA